MNRTVEKYYPFVLSVSSVVFMEYFLLKITPNPQQATSIYKNLLSQSLSVNTTLLGFFLTIFTILNTIDTVAMKYVRALGLEERLKGFLASAIKANFVATAVILLSNFEFESTFWAREIFRISVLFVLAYALFLSIRFSALFVRIATSTNK